MRYDKPIFFQRITPGEYNASTGDYGEDVVVEVSKYASVTSSGATTLKLVYGGIKQGSMTVRLQAHHTEPFDLIRIDGKRYRVDMERKLRNAHVFVVSEVQ